MLAFVHRLHNADDRMSVADLSKVGLRMHSFSLLRLLETFFIIKFSLIDLQILPDIIHGNGFDFAGLIL